MPTDSPTSITEADRAAAHALIPRVVIEHCDAGKGNHDAWCTVIAQALANHAASARAEEREVLTVVITTEATTWPPWSDAHLALARMRDAISRRSP
jgi:hypothetical protein